MKELLDTEVENAISCLKSAVERDDIKFAAQIQDALREAGIVLYSSPQGVIWQRKAPTSK